MRILMQVLFVAPCSGFGHVPYKFVTSLLHFGPAGVSASQIDYFGLYDCFPICFIRAVEAAGGAPPLVKFILVFH